MSRDAESQPGKLSGDDFELLAYLLEDEVENFPADESLAIAPLGARPESLPLSFAQERLWFLDQLDPGSVGYNFLEILNLTGPVDLEALQASFSGLIARHEVLRTNFRLADGCPVQVVAQASHVPLPVTDLTGVVESAHQAAVRRLAREEIDRSFDLSADLMVRVGLLRLREDEHVLLLTDHHIAADGWTMNVLWGELAQLYAAASQAGSPDLAPMRLQYADFAVWQRQWFRGEVLETQLRYWREQLASLPMLELPTDHPRPRVQTYRGGGHELRLPEPLVNALADLARRQNATLFMVLFSAFAVLLSRYTGQEDVVVGSPISGRNRTEIEGLIGFFVNTLVLRADLSGKPDFSELLRRVREMTLAAYEHQDLPFEKLVEELAPERNLSQNPLAQVMFALQNTISSEPTLPGLSVERVNLDVQNVRFDLEFHVLQDEEGLLGRILYNIDLFESATIQRLIGHYRTLLEAIAYGPDTPVSELPMLAGAERDQLLVAWNDTAADYPRGRCIHELFEEQVELSPSATALIHEERQLTYAELNAHANQLAHHLKARGAELGVLVALCVERSLEMVIGLLGILKTGAAYVPLDAAAPPNGWPGCSRTPGYRSW